MAERTGDRRVLRARVVNARGPDTVELLDDAVVAIDGGAIGYIGRWTGERVDEDLRDGGVLVPGFVDAHVHYPQTRIVGRASGPLLAWLAASTFPEEALFADLDHARQVAELFLDALAAAGTTYALAYGPVFAEATRALLEAAERRGQRLAAGPVLMDAHSPDALVVPVEPAIAALASLSDDWHGRSGCAIAAIPRFALSCTPEMMAAAGALAADRGLLVSTHLAETVDECRIATERFGTHDYLEVYERAGLVRAGAVFAHCIHLSDDEWDRFATAGAVVAHCPDSNDFLGSGGMPVDAPRARGVAIGLGTDVAAGRSFRIPRIGSSAYDNALRQGVALSPAQILWWATRGGALALGRQDTGMIAAGHAADLAWLRVPSWASSLDDVLAAILFDHDAGPALRTWVAGRVVWPR